MGEYTEEEDLGPDLRVALAPTPEPEEGEEELPGAA